MARMIVLLALLAGCANQQLTHGIPNFHVVDEYIARGGQPQDAAACKWLVDNGYTTWIKYSYEREASSKTCEAAGIIVLHFEMPPSDARDFVERPKLSVVKAAVAALLACRDGKKKCFEGCLHGWDRTGLLTALYRWLSGELDREAAWQEALAMGFHRIYHELSDVWEDWK